MQTPRFIQYMFERKAPVFNLIVCSAVEGFGTKGNQRKANLTTGK